MSILFAGLLLSVWGLLVFSAPKRKRYRPRRQRTAGHCDIDGEDVDTTSGFDDGSGDGGGDGGDGGGDAGGGDCGGGDGGGGDGGGGCGGGD